MSRSLSSVPIKFPRKFISTVGTLVLLYDIIMITTHFIVRDYYALISTSYFTYIRLTIYYVKTVQVLFTEYYELVYLLYINFYYMLSRKYSTSTF